MSRGHIELVHATQVWCTPYQDTTDLRTSAIYAEADGELLGKLPVKISVVPDAFNLLIPAKS